MDANDLMEIVHEAYPDETTRECWDEKLRRARCPSRGGLCKVRAGDTLAEFIVQELFETYDKDASDEKQLARALSVLDVALNDLGAVAAALNRRLSGISDGHAHAKAS